MSRGDVFHKNMVTSIKVLIAALSGKPTAGLIPSDKYERKDHVTTFMNATRPYSKELRLKWHKVLERAGYPKQSLY
jgi:hypothetical protein